MKKLLSLIIASLCVTACFSQSKMFVSTGTTFSYLDGWRFKLKDQFGYYAGIGIIDAVNKKSALVSDFQYLYQRASNKMVRNGSHSLNISVNYQYTPFDFKLNFLAGLQMGFVMNSKVRTQDAIVRDRDVRFSGVGGLSYDLNKFSVMARYSHKFDGSDVFDSCLQLGILRKIN